jgi:hypothetical protein
MKHFTLLALFLCSIIGLQAQEKTTRGGYITGYEILCSTNQRSYTARNLPSGTTVVWSVSTQLTVVSTNGNTITVKPSSTNYSGNAYIYANYAANSIIKKIHIGTPKPQIWGMYEEDCHCMVAHIETGKSYYLRAYGNNLSNNDSDYRWTIYSPNTVIPIGPRDRYFELPMLGSGKQLDFRPGTPGKYRFTLKYNGVCGWSKETEESYTVHGEGYFEYRTYPNPARDFINIERVSTVDSRESDATKCNIKVYDNMQNIVATKKNCSSNTRLNISDLKPGQYIIRIENGNSVKAIQFMKK